MIIYGDFVYYLNTVLQIQLNLFHTQTFHLCSQGRGMLIIPWLPGMSVPRPHMGWGSLGLVSHGPLGRVSHCALWWVSHGSLGWVSHSSLGWVSQGLTWDVSHGSLGLVSHGSLGLVSHGSLGWVSHCSEEGPMVPWEESHGIGVTWLRRMGIS